jgi:hypothetical protein
MLLFVIRRIYEQYLFLLMNLTMSWMEEGTAKVSISNEDVYYNLSVDLINR